MAQVSANYSRPGLGGDVASMGLMPVSISNILAAENEIEISKATTTISRVKRLVLLTPFCFRNQKIPSFFYRFKYVVNSHSSLGWCMKHRMPRILCWKGRI